MEPGKIPQLDQLKAWKALNVKGDFALRLRKLAVA